MMALLLLACGDPVASARPIPVDGAPAWSDPTLAGCELTAITESGASNVPFMVDTYDTAGARVASRGGDDGVDELGWTHTWSGEEVTTVGEPLAPDVVFTDLERRVFAGPRRLRFEIDMYWMYDDMGMSSRGAYVTTWEDDLPVWEDWYDEPEATSRVGGAAWNWSEDRAEAEVVVEDGTSYTLRHDEHARPIERVRLPVSGGSPYEQRTTWSWGARGPERSEYDNDEDGVPESVTTWTYDCP